MVFDGVKSIIKGISVSLFFIFFMNKKKTRVEEFCSTDRNKKHQFHDCGFSTAPFPFLDVRSFCYRVSYSEEIRLFGFVCGGGGKYTNILITCGKLRSFHYPNNNKLICHQIYFRLNSFSAGRGKNSMCLFYAGTSCMFLSVA